MPYYTDPPRDPFGPTPEEEEAARRAASAPPVMAGSPMITPPAPPEPLFPEPATMRAGRAGTIGPFASFHKPPPGRLVADPTPYGASAPVPMGAGGVPSGAPSAPAPPIMPEMAPVTPDFNEEAMREAAPMGLPGSEDPNSMTARQLAEDIVLTQERMGPKKGFFGEMFEAMMETMANGRGALYNMLDYGTGRAQERKRAEKTLMYEGQIGRERDEMRQAEGDDLSRYKAEAGYNVGMARVAQEEAESMRRYAEFIAKEGSAREKLAVETFWAKGQKIPREYPGLSEWLYDVEPPVDWDYHVTNDQIVRTRGDQVEVQRTESGQAAKPPSASEVGAIAEGDAEGYLTTQPGRAEVDREVFERLPRLNPKWSSITDETKLAAYLASLEEQLTAAGNEITVEGPNLPYQRLQRELQELQSAYMGLREKAPGVVKGRYQAKRAATEYQRPRGASSGAGSFGGTGLPTNGRE
jgi:hypothetical protein